MSLSLELWLLRKMFHFSVFIILTNSFFNHLCSQGKKKKTFLVLKQLPKKLLLHYINQKVILKSCHWNFHYINLKYSYCRGSSRFYSCISIIIWITKLVRIQSFRQGWGFSKIQRKMRFINNVIKKMWLKRFMLNQGVIKTRMLSVIEGKAVNALVCLW